MNRRDIYTRGADRLLSGHNVFFTIDFVAQDFQAVLTSVKMTLIPLGGSDTFISVPLLGWEAVVDSDQLQAIYRAIEIQFSKHLTVPTFACISQSSRTTPPIQLRRPFHFGASRGDVIFRVAGGDEYLRTSAAKVRKEGLVGKKTLFSDEVT